MALDLARAVLQDLFPGVEEEGLRTHPDIHWLFPEKKSRIVSVEAVHEKFIDPMSQTSFSGGWRVGVLVGADRLNPAGANAFLKTLEEPPARTLFLLLTDAPEQLLPTIISRCQRIDLPDSREHQLADPWRTNVLGVLSNPDLADTTAAGFLQRAAAADRLLQVPRVPARLPFYRDGFLRAPDASRPRHQRLPQYRGGGGDGAFVRPQHERGGGALFLHGSRAL